eukprot:GFUD01053668.1.p1 GENE.GFUD01053668.1~~GFUD01053668.1.p1  ORF type:complete len:166 (-),score=19.19 GFUD01053668.1:144-641(-)
MVNNTLLIIQANISASLQCQEKSQQLHINGTVLLKIPNLCQLTSIHLNISSYNVVSLTEQKILTVSTDNPYLHYHEEIQNMSKLKNLKQEELTKLMTRILDGKKRINKLESKVVEQDGLQDTAKKALKWIDTKWEQWEIICIIVSFSIISVLVLSVTIVVISKFC